MNHYDVTGMLDPTPIEKREDGRLILRSDYDTKMSLLRQAWTAMCEAAARPVSKENFAIWNQCREHFDTLLNKED